MAENLPPGVDINEIPGIVPYPAGCPPFKKTILDKKNKAAIDAYMANYAEIQKEKEAAVQRAGAAEAKKKAMEEKFAKMPAWKRDAAIKKAAKEEAEAEAAAAKS